MGKNVLIIGAGPAGLAAAEVAVSLGAAVTLAGAEPYPPYWRPKLTRYLSEPVPAESFAMRKPQWYGQNGVKLLLGQTAERVNTADRKVLWKSGGNAPFDALVIATGASPFLPEIAGAENARTLRTYDDAVKIREAALSSGKAAVIGGGLLGLETAWELNTAGIKVTLVERGDWLLPRQLNREAGLYLQRRLESSGITLVVGKDPSTCAEAFTGACVVLAAGVRANLDALEGSGIAVNRGIVVDERMRTSAEGVFACGDAAEFMGRSWGLLGVAQEQGKIAGINAAGGDTAYIETPPSPMLKVGTVSVFSVGDVAGSESATRLERENADGYACLVLKEDLLVGATLVGDTKIGMKLRKAVADARRFKQAQKIEDVLSAI